MGRAPDDRGGDRVPVTHTFHSRLLLVIVGLVVVAQVGTSVAMFMASRHTADLLAEQQLSTAERLVQDTFAARDQQYRNSLLALAGDLRVPRGRGESRHTDHQFGPRQPWRADFRRPGGAARQLGTDHRQHRFLRHVRALIGARPGAEQCARRRARAGHCRLQGHSLAVGGGAGARAHRHRLGGHGIRTARLCRGSDQGHRQRRCHLQRAQRGQRLGNRRLDAAAVPTHRARPADPAAHRQRRGGARGGAAGARNTSARRWPSPAATASRSSRCCSCRKPWSMRR